jgi:hypothetical protein
MTPLAGTTKSGAPYIMKYMDSFGNICTRNNERPVVISQFFSDSNTIDSHNQASQANLALEKKWLTKDPWFRLTTTLIGINEMDTWKLASFHGIINSNKSDPDKMMAITRFAGIVGHQLIHSAASLSQSSFSTCSCFAFLLSFVLQMFHRFQLQIYQMMSYLFVLLPMQMVWCI